MTNPAPENLHIRRQPIPGGGSRDELSLQDEHQLVIVHPPGTERRELHVFTTSDDDEPTASVSLTPAEAMTVATLLSNIRIHIEVPSEPAEAARVETMRIGGASQAVGKRPDELPITDPDHARILAVIRDDTPELVEDDPGQACRPGDRLVVAGRSPHLDSLRRYLL